MKKIIALLLSLMMCICTFSVLAEATTIAEPLPEPAQQEAVLPNSDTDVTEETAHSSDQNVQVENVTSADGKISEISEGPVSLEGLSQGDSRSTDDLISTANLIRYIPVVIIIDDDINVLGYFVNLNDNVAVGNFYDFELTVYASGKRIADGEFGTINQFTIEPLGSVLQAFTFEGAGKQYQSGTYVCKDDDYALTGFRYKTMDR